MTELEIASVREVLNRIVLLTEMYPNYATEQIALVADVGLKILPEEVVR